MCLAKIYPPGALEPVMEDVAQVTFENGRIVAESLFGEKKIFEGKIRTISFAESKVQLAADTR